MLTLTKYQWVPAAKAFAEYSCESYGADAYGHDCIVGGDLTNTGQDVLLPAIVGAVLIIGGIIGALKLRKKK